MTGKIFSVLVTVFSTIIFSFPDCYPQSDNFVLSGKIAPRLESKSETKYYTKLTFSYESTVRNRLPDTDIWIYLYLPKGANRCPLVLFLPHSIGVSNLIEINFAEFLAENGFAFLTMETGFQKKREKYGHIKTKMKDVKSALLYLDLMKELTIESQNVLDWVKVNGNVDPEKICIGGVSLGSVVSEFVLAGRDDVSCGLFLLGGADLKTLFLDSGLFKGIRDSMLNDEKSREELLRFIKLLDPVNSAAKLKNKKVLMFNAIFDPFLPRQCALKLWDAAGKQEIKWLPCGHISSILQLGYVQNRSLEFLNENLKEEFISGKVRFGAYTGEKSDFSYENKRIKVISRLKYSSKDRRIKLGFEKTDLFDTPFFSGLAFNGRWESDERYRLKGEFMPDIYLGLPLSRFSDLKVGFSSYQYNVYHLSDKAASDFRTLQGRSKTNFLSVDFLRKSVNDKFYPTKGTWFNAGYDYSGLSMGSDFDFFRLETEYRNYFDLGNYRVFVIRTKFGAQSGNKTQIPFFERFYLGGSGSVRGYRGKRFGPLDDEGLSLGGKYYHLMNLEFRMPVYRKWYGAVFFDEGGLVNKVSDFDISKLKFGAGVGLRYRTKWGFARLDFGFKIGSDRDKSRYKMHTTFGLPF